MIVLDENVFESQWAQLRFWRVHLCQIGRDIGHKRMQDEEILTLLQQQRRSTFISRDRDFFKKSLCNDRYCLAYLHVNPLQVAEYVWRLLRHKDFRTWSQRKGCVLRVAANGISAWRLGIARVSRSGWVN